MESIGRTLMIGGAVIFLLGAGLFLAAKLGLPLGRLPGDIRIEREGFSLYLPLTSAILVSVVLTIVVNVIVRLWKK
jgi:hypothetical protein